MTAILNLNNVAAEYSHGVPVLDALNLDVQSGEIVGILGPNGAGKTTLFRLLSGLLNPLRGEIRVFGHPLHALNARDRARLIGVAPQDMQGPTPFSVHELVAMSRMLWRTRWWSPRSDREDHHAIDQALALTDLTEHRDRPLDTLSGGEKQRAIIAMAIARQPPLLLLDEATSNLDMNHRLEIMQIVERLNREIQTTVLMISHDMNLSADFCRRLLLLDHGRIVADGSPRTVLQANRLASIYHCDVAVHHDPQRGVVTVNPTRRFPVLPPDAGRRCHVIAGGGSAAELLRRLCLSGYRVSCGVLNQGDTDAALADALGLATVLEQPFSPVSDRQLAAARTLASDCRLCIVSAVPFGPGNIVNLSIADAILKHGGQVWIARDVAARDYTPDQSATRHAERLLDAGAKTWENINALMQHLIPNPTVQRSEDHSPQNGDKHHE